LPLDKISIHPPQRHRRRILVWFRITCHVRTSMTRETGGLKTDLRQNLPLAIPILRSILASQPSNEMRMSKISRPVDAEIEKA
jgi:hypothetical protein